MAERFTANFKKLGLVIHADFIVGLPGESRESIRKTIVPGLLPSILSVSAEARTSG
jgi:hypothetical protein